MSVILDDFYSGDGVKDTYREYLEKWGIIDTIQGILNKLMMKATKPDNPLDFIREQLCGEPLSAEAMDAMDEELDNAEREIQRLRNILDKLGYRDEENIEMKHDEYDIDDQS